MGNYLIHHLFVCERYDHIDCRILIGKEHPLSIAEDAKRAQSIQDMLEASSGFAFPEAPREPAQDNQCYSEHASTNKKGDRSCQE
jgi:hypothetical protein